MVKYIYILIYLSGLFSCRNVTNNQIIESRNTPLDSDILTERTISENMDSLFQIEMELNSDFVRIIPSLNSDFELPDSTTITSSYKMADFNADGKQDVLIYLGDCGTGGCNYGLFIKKHSTFYKLAYLDYLKNPQFEKDHDGYLTIQSFEELEAYNPDKIEVRIFKFDSNTERYELDSIYVSTE